MLNRVEDIAEASVRLIGEEIPAYRTLQDEGRFIADVSDQVHKHHVMNMISLLEDRPVTLEEISFVRGQRRGAPARGSRSRTTSTPTGSASRISGTRSSRWPARRPRAGRRRSRSPRR